MRTRTYLTHKTREGKPKVTLYEDGQVRLRVVASSPKRAAALGRSWADSCEPVISEMTDKENS